MPSPDDLPGALDPMAGAGAATTAPATANGKGNRVNGTNGRTHGTGNGNWVGEPAPEGRRRPPGPSTKPALVVLGLTLLLFMVGVGLELASGTQSRPTPGATQVATARGAVLHAVPARPLLKAITAAGQPPDDLLDAIAVPRGATPVAGSATDQGVELYDRSLRLAVPASQADVISFFRAQLPAQHWRRLSQGPTSAGSGYLILEQHPASDGHEWDIGVTVSPTSFAGTATGITSFTLRLYSVSDQD